MNGYTISRRYGGRNHRNYNQYSMGCIFITVLLDLTAGITDSFEGREGGLLEVLRYFCLGIAERPLTMKTENP